MSRSQRSDGGKAAGLWAIDVLERQLGRDWPELVWKAERRMPPELANASGHAVAFAELLDFALQLELLREAPGMGKVRRTLMTDLRSQARAHTRVQLQL